MNGVVLKFLRAEKESLRIELAVIRENGIIKLTNGLAF